MTRQEGVDIRMFDLGGDKLDLNWRRIAEHLEENYTPDRLAWALASLLQTTEEAET